MTPAGHAALRAEYETSKAERHRVVEIVSWAAGNGDRSENADYKEGKRRLREIDRRLRYLTQRLDAAEVVDPAAQPRRDQVFFGATVTYADPQGDEHVVTILGIDEANSALQQVSWVSPIARALIKARVGDVVRLATPAGVQELEVLDVDYTAADPSPGP